MKGLFPDPAWTLPLHLRQAIADQQHSPRVNNEYNAGTPLQEAWGWLIENWSEHDWKEFALGGDLFPLE